LRNCHRVFVFAIIALSVASTSVAAIPPKKVLIIDIPRFSFSDIANHTPNLLKMMEHAAVGIMTTPLSESKPPEQVYFAFNSGTQVKSPAETLLFYDCGDRYREILAGEVFYSLTGSRPKPENVVNLGFSKTVQFNTPSIANNIGLFGKTLHQNHFQTGVIGNSDTDIINRSGAIMLMDDRGTIDYGAVGDVTLDIDPNFPSQKRTNLSNLHQQWSEVWKRADVVVVTLGDLERIQRFGDYLTDERWDFYRKETMTAYDRFLGKLLQQVDRQTTLTLFFSAVPPQRGRSFGETLTPMIITGPGFERGLLVSSSTRKNGLVTCYDPAVTILRYLGIRKPGNFTGHRLESKPGNWKDLINRQQSLVTNYQLRWPMLLGYGYLLIGMVLIAILGLIFWRNQLKFFKVLSLVFLFLLSFPMVFLWESLINPLDWFSVIGITFGLSGLIVATGYLLLKGERLKILGMISALTIITVMLDGLGNGFLELFSFLGYSAVSGARFYGIGNEYMGVLIGSIIAFITLNYQQFFYKKVEYLWAGMCLAALLIAHPNFGANIGGGVTAVLGLGITNYLLTGRKIRLKEVFGLLATSTLLLVGIAIWDTLISGKNATHYGQLIGLIKDSGWKGVFDLLTRKWELNTRLFNYTPWSKVLLAILVVAPLLYKKPPKGLAPFFIKYDTVLKGCLGLISAALIALLVNDSGIAAMATMFIFGCSMLLLILFDEYAKPSRG
jgi:hypothetical protein